MARIRIEDLSPEAPIDAARMRDVMGGFFFYRSVNLSGGGAIQSDSFSEIAPTRFGTSYDYMGGSGIYQAGRLY